MLPNISSTTGTPLYLGGPCFRGHADFVFNDAQWAFTNSQRHKILFNRELLGNGVRQSA